MIQICVFSTSGREMRDGDIEGGGGEDGFRSSIGRTFLISQSKVFLSSFFNLLRFGALSGRFSLL